ncbi:MAG TPA: hypothetical protein VGH86_11700 [Phenylobacterium sp.]
MQRVRVLLGLLAAIILMIGGAPATAAANPCNPCPPDCAMMAQMAMAAADHQAPGKSKAENPCKSTAVCQSAFAVPLLPQTAADVVLLAETTEHDLVGALAAPSRPPDPTLRPPIQL